MKKLMNYLRTGKHRLIAAITITMVLLLVVGCSQRVITQSNTIPSQVLEWSDNNVMSVATGGGVGSGFWIDNETFVTAGHVVCRTLLSGVMEDDGSFTKTEEYDQYDNLRVTSNDGKTSLLLRTKTCDIAKDIAVLKRDWREDDSDFTAIDTAGVQADIGEGVYCSGYGMGVNLHTTVGHFWGVGHGWFAKYQVITCNTIWGDSGSPAVVLRDGVVSYMGVRQAVVNGGDAPIEHLTLIHDAKAIAKYL